MATPVALIIIDMQVGVFESAIIPPVAGASQLLLQVDTLIAKARHASAPVIYVQHSGGSGHPSEFGTPGWHIHPDILPLPQDILIQKRTPDSFSKTQLQNALESLQVKKLVIAGIQTEFCVDTTCRRAFSLGYEVILASDAHSTWDNGPLSAAQIIEHHNRVLGEWFATLEMVSEIDFAALQGDAGAWKQGESNTHPSMSTFVPFRSLFRRSYWS